MTQGNKWGMAIMAAVLVLAAVAVGLGGCAPPGGGGSVVAAEGQPVTALDEVQVFELVAGNTEFALDLYRTLSGVEENLLLSPYSLSAALAMTYVGARTETERQMAQALHFSLPQAQLHPAFNVLDQALQGTAEPDVDLHLANALWGRQGTSFRDAYLDTLARHYGAGLRTADFQQAEEARQQINHWVAEQTAGRIKDLLPSGAVDAEMELVLTNAVYFQAAWAHPFAEDRTRDGAFTLPDGSRVTVPMMVQVENLGYAERPGVQTVELPYAGGALSMVVLLPEAGTFEAFAAGLDGGELDAILSGLEPAGVQLAMPRFGFESALRLKEPLMELGMVDAFGDADFSGMDGTHELFIDDVYHQTFVAVDEAGTEAAGSTAVVMKRKGRPIPEHEVSLDRPFLMLIRDRESGTILFLGHVVNPVPEPGP